MVHAINLQKLNPLMLARKFNLDSRPRGGNWTVYQTIKLIHRKKETILFVLTKKKGSPSPLVLVIPTFRIYFLHQCFGVVIGPLGAGQPARKLFYSPREVHKNGSRF